MSWVTSYFGSGLAVIPNKTDLDVFKITKIRSPTSCRVCSKTLPNKSWVFGGGSSWVKLCLDCGEKFTHQGIKRIEEVIEYIKLNQELLKKNKEKYESENVLNSL